nr:hypothetical protein [Tanacetum cinerariifolium]
KNLATTSCGKKKTTHLLIPNVSAEDVSVEEPAYNEEEANLQWALELSLKEQAERTQGPARLMVIREPNSGRIQPLLDVQGKGKDKVVDEQAAHDLLTLLTPKNKSLVDQFIFQRDVVVVIIEVVAIDVESGEPEWSLEEPRRYLDE